MLGEDAPRGALAPCVTSGEAIISCINDVQQPAMREMDSVRGRSAADDGRQRRGQRGQEEKGSRPTSGSTAGRGHAEQITRITQKINLMKVHAFGSSREIEDAVEVKRSCR